jgi:hypothetical protein
VFARLRANVMRAYCSGRPLGRTRRRLTSVALGVALLGGGAAIEGSSTAGARPVATVTATRVYIACLRHDGSSYRRVYRPSHCAHFGPGGSFSGGVNLRNLHWKYWNRGTARATGIEQGFHLPPERIRVRVKAYRIRSGCGRRAYTRLRVTSSHGTTVVRLSPCSGPAY